MNNKKMMTIPVILIMGLATIGAAYAGWHDIVTIDGTVYMGDLEIAWNVSAEPIRCAFSYRLEDGTFEDVPPEKIGVTRCIIEPKLDTEVEQTSCVRKTGYKTMNWTIEGAYPQLKFSWLNPLLDNIGTIPVKIYNITITGYDEKDLHDLKFVWTQFNWPSVVNPAQNKHIGWFWDPGLNKVFDDPLGSVDDKKIIQVTVVGYVGEQIEPCHWIKHEIDIFFSQEAEECHTYTFEITFDGVQWNKWYEVEPWVIPGPP
jgi:hypothetical protein